ncbi:nicotinate (nicotinamide) nucleotide adenylyltransferase [Rubritalea tangerina]|uniref:Probable nicotinate-nucleotide adenylyltransferase n=2 Tax=Rubritalea tangerina TaxID=430798 RepID=A0ABW4Z870_9BACT
MTQPQPKICLFGGTFDPIHLGHTYIAQQAKKRLNLDKVIFLPCRQSPHKSKQNSLSDDTRLHLCHLATNALPWAEVSDYDLIAPPPSYSFRTAQHFHNLYPNAKLYWLMGTDQWQALPRWKNATEFAELLEVIVYSRTTPPSPITGFTCHTLNLIQHPASATQIRQQLSTGKTTPWLHPAVAETLKENHHFLK